MRHLTCFDRGVVRIETCPTATPVQAALAAPGAAAAAGVAVTLDADDPSGHARISLDAVAPDEVWLVGRAGHPHARQPLCDR